MDNKTRVKVAVVIGIVVLAVIFILMVFFVKGNREPKTNPNIPVKEYGNSDATNSSTNGTAYKNSGSKENVPVEEIESIGISNGNLVAIKEDLEAVTIKKLDNRYFNFCVGQNEETTSVYVTYMNSDGSFSINQINLEENYPEKEILATDEYGSINNLEYYSGKLYFVSGNEQLIEYSIEEKFSRSLTNENEVSSFAIDEENNCLYVSYKPDGENPGIYVIDLTSNTYNQIIVLNEFAGELMLNGNALVLDAKENGRLYLYNSSQNTISDVGDCNLLEAKYQVAFYNDMLIYTDGEKIDIKTETGESYQDDWYSLNDSSISEISMISQNTLQISRSDENGKVSKSIVINLEDGTTTERLDTVYSDVVLLQK